MPEPKFSPGDFVQRINAAEQVGLVRAVRWQPQAELYIYEVVMGQAIKSVYESSLRLLPPAQSPWDDLRGGVSAGARAFRTSMTRHRVLRTPSRIAKSFSSARTQFYPHQFKPLLKLLDSTQKRMLIADDVGLGKTIEAGYILLELEAERRLPHVLVVAPSRLLTKWKDELKNRFDQKFDIVRTATIRQALANETPPVEFRWIASYETLRNLKEQIQQAPLEIDCLFFDEAHRLRNPATDTHRVGALLCERADSVVMLSATPIQTKMSDLYSLARLLLPEEFTNPASFHEQMTDNQFLIQALQQMRGVADDPSTAAGALASLDNFLQTESGRALAASLAVQKVRALLSKKGVSREELIATQSTMVALSPINHFFIRTRKIDAIPNAPVREPMWISVELTPRERKIYDVVVEACRAQARGSQWGADQSAIMTYRAVASCIPAAMRHFRGEIQGSLADAFEEDASEAEATGDHAPDAHFVAPQNMLQNAIRESTRLFEQLGGTDTKFQKLYEALCELWSEDARANRPPRKCIIFSYFRGSVEYLRQRLQHQNVPCASVHGGVPVGEREAVLDPFKTDLSVNVLVTSDVSAEGVDLQMACVMFNYDLPWNPMVVEQRVGRIDRIGQVSRVLTIANLVVKDSIEERILKRLFVRIRLIESSIGEVGAVLGDLTPVERLTQRALLGVLDETELEKQIEAAGRAFDIQRDAAAELDKRAGDLLAIDQAILDEIRAATGDHQIPNERHILEFVNSALNQHSAGAMIDDAALHGVVRIDFRNVFGSRPFEPKANDTERARVFMQRAQHGAVDITLSREVAYRYPNVEIVHATHPLVRWAAGSELPEATAYSLELPSSIVLSPGSYVWAISFLESAGSSAGLRMVGVFLPTKDPGRAVSAPQDVSIIVGELLDKAIDVHLPWHTGEASSEIDDVVEETKAALDEVTAQLNQRERELFDLRESARLARMRAGLESVSKRAAALLQRYLAEDAAPFVTRMQERKVKAADDRLMTLDRSFTNRQWVDLDRTEVAIGHLIVGGPNDGAPSRN